MWGMIPWSLSCDEPPAYAARAQSESGMPTPPVGIGGGSGNFYLAIRKDALEQPWFLSAYMKQYHPGNAGVAAGSTLGTRVVAFREQNDKVFLFDTSHAAQISAVFDPQILLEAYPVVHLPAFERLRGSEQYILFDPAGGLNRFLSRARPQRSSISASRPARRARVPRSRDCHRRPLRDASHLRMTL